MHAHIFSMVAALPDEQKHEEGHCEPGEADQPEHPMQLRTELAIEPAFGKQWLDLEDAVQADLGVERIDLAERPRSQVRKQGNQGQANAERADGGDAGTADQCRPSGGSGMPGIERRTPPGLQGSAHARRLRSAAAIRVQTSASPPNRLRWTNERRSFSLAQNPSVPRSTSKAAASAVWRDQIAPDRGRHGGLAEQPDQADARQARREKRQASGLSQIASAATRPAASANRLRADRRTAARSVQAARQTTAGAGVVVRATEARIGQHRGLQQQRQAGEHARREQDRPRGPIQSDHSEREAGRTDQHAPQMQRAGQERLQQPGAGESRASSGRVQCWTWPSGGLMRGKRDRTSCRCRAVPERGSDACTRRHRPGRRQGPAPPR